MRATPEATNNQAPETSITNRHAQQIERLRRMYPHLIDKELERARDNLERYLLVAMKIYNRLQIEQGAPTFDRTKLSSYHERTKVELS